MNHSSGTPHASRVPVEQALPTKARTYITVVSVLGILALAMAVIRWESADILKFASFLAVAVASSGIRLTVPGAVSPLPLTFLFVLFGVAELSLAETVILAGVITFAQCFWVESGRPSLAQVSFTVSAFSLAAAGAAWIYQTPILASEFDSSVRMAFATLVLFLANTLPVALAVSLSEEVGWFAVWRECFLRSLPFYFGGGVTAQLASLGSQVFGWPTVLLTGPVVYLIFRSYRLYIGRLENERKHMADVSALHLRTIQALAMAIEAKDDTTSAHLERVQIYAREIGKDLGLTDAEQEALQAASILHDIGKLAVPEHIISKPGRLTPEEFEKMKIHPVVGAEILESVQFPYPVAPIVRAHHEKWDGTGYPNGLRGEEIPIGARILAAVDCLDALSTDRQYRRAMPLDEAMKILQKDSGKHFDPRIVDLLSQRYVELEKQVRTEAAKHEPVKLSKDIKIERGLAPAAGFESVSVAALAAAQTQDLDPLASIAAARHEVQSLFEISQDLGSSLSLSDTLSVLGARLRGILPHHSLVIWLKRDGALHPEYVAGDDYRLFTSLAIPVGQGLSGWVAENRKSILNGNPSVETGYLNDTTKFSTLRSALAVPLEGVNDVMGVLALYHADRDAFTKDHLRVLLAINSKIGLSIENALRFQQSEASTTNDPLTGLPNARSLFVQLDSELSRSRRTNQPVAVVTLDLDNFKHVNQRHGQIEGNRLLKGVANALKSICREYDVVARMGGDEFVMVLSGPRPGEMDSKLEQIRTVVGQACRDVIMGEPLRVSIGTAHYPADGSDAEALLAEADKRMYAEKRTQLTRATAAPRTFLARLHKERESVLV